MAISEKSKLKCAIEVFYLQTPINDRKSTTYHKFKDSKLNGSLAFTKQGLYKMFSRIDERGSDVRKSGSGRPPVLSSGDQAKLKRAVNHKTGQSQRKLAIKFHTSKTTIQRNLKKNGLKFRKRKRAPKQTPAQKLRQEERLAKFVDNLLEDDDRDLVIDDESYFTFTGAGMPGNSGFYTTDPNITPPEIKFNQVAKFDSDKVMIWVAFSRRGISDIYFAPKKLSMDQETYRKQCLEKRLFKFIDENYDSRSEILFWPDLASCHYATKTQEFLTEIDINFVPRDHNPPNAPQIRPIENFFGILKQHVYAGNWSAKNREGLIRRIKKCVQEIDMDMIIKMFDNLPPKIVKAKNHGLDSLL